MKAESPPSLLDAKDQTLPSTPYFSPIFMQFVYCVLFRASVCAYAYVI
jgi:hypothetical protein